MIINPYAFGGTTLLKYRVKATAVQAGGNFGCSEVEFRAAVGGADQTGGGTATSGGDFSGSFPPSNAFDDNNGTDWAATNGGGLNNWIASEFNSIGPIVEMAWRTRSGTAGDAPITIEVDQWNGSAWVFAWSDWMGSVLDWTTGTTRRSSSTGKQAWRVMVTTNSGGGLGFAEIEMHTSIGGSDVTTGGVAFCDSQFNGSFPPSNAFDNSNATEWVASNGTTINSAIGYRFATSTDIVEVKLTARGAGASNQSGSAGKLQFWNKATAAWADQFTWTTSNTWSANESRTFS